MAASGGKEGQEGKTRVTQTEQAVQGGQAWGSEPGSQGGEEGAGGPSRIRGARLEWLNLQHGRLWAVPPELEGQRAVPRKSQQEPLRS